MARLMGDALVVARAREGWLKLWQFAGAAVALDSDDDNQEINTEIVPEPYYLSMDCESLAAEHNSLLRDLKKHSSNKSAGLSAAKIAVFFIEDKLRVTEAAYKINKCAS